MRPDSTSAYRRFRYRLLRSAGPWPGGPRPSCLVLAAAWWSSEPGAADPPLLVVEAGPDRHHLVLGTPLNYWMEWSCARKGIIPGMGLSKCLSWKREGTVWKPCGPTIQTAPTGPHQFVQHRAARRAFITRQRRDGKVHLSGPARGPDADRPLRCVWATGASRRTPDRATAARG